MSSHKGGLIGDENCKLYMIKFVQPSPENPNNKILPLKSKKIPYTGDSIIDIHYISSLRLFLIADFDGRLYSLDDKTSTVQLRKSGFNFEANDQMRTIRSYNKTAVLNNYNSIAVLDSLEELEFDSMVLIEV